MIYSDEINKVCALCQHASPIEGNENEMQCSKTQKNTAMGDSCAKFKYDIFKKPVRRRRRLNVHFSREDFTL